MLEQVSEWGFLNPPTALPLYMDVAITDEYGNSYMSQSEVPITAGDPGKFFEYGATVVLDNVSRNGNGATHLLGFTNSNPIPAGGSLSITVPEGIEVSDESSVYCVIGCVDNVNRVVTYDETSRTFLVQGVFVNYLSYFEPISVVITDLKNPSDFSYYEYEIVTYGTLDGQLSNLIDADTLPLVLPAGGSFDRVKLKSKNI